MNLSNPQELSEEWSVCTGKGGITPPSYATYSRKPSAYPPLESSFQQGPESYPNSPAP